MDAKPIKEKVKAKAKAVKERLKGAAKASKPVKAAGALALGAFLLAGCQTPEQASRATHSRYGDIGPEVEVEAVGSNTVSVAVHITIGDGAIASADSSGSTETQTQTPTFDLRTRVDARYNDAMAAATTASREVLGSLTAADAGKVLSLMADRATGTVEVQKADGGAATVKCENGQCSFCAPAAD